MTAKEILVAAKNRISDPERWTQGSYARTVNGYSISSWDDRAVCWCATGAIDAERTFGISNALERGYAETVLSNVSNELFGESLVGVNDNLGHSSVMQVYDRAIEMS